MVLRSPSARQPDVDPSDLHLQRLFHWEKAAPDQLAIWATQPELVVWAV